MNRWIILGLVCIATIPGEVAGQDKIEKGLVGYWKLKGDCKNYSGNSNHGTNHGVDLANSQFNGKNSYIEVENNDVLNFGKGNFSICAWVYTEKDMSDVIGDIMSKYDTYNRRGFTFNIKASSGGYNSQGNDKHVYFGIDDGAIAKWQDCGKPSKTSNYVSNSLTVYDGNLYAAITDAERQEDWCHVYRYEGGQKWTDCGRVGNLKTTGVGPLIVHNGKLYAATWTCDWTRVTRVKNGTYDYCRVYSYEGDKEWKDCGQPGKNLRLYSLASYKGKLYVLGDNAVNRGGKCFVYQGGIQWQGCKQFEEHPHPMCVSDGKLYVGVHGAVVYAYDGENWTNIGNPYPGTCSEFRLPHCNQIHSLEVYRGKLCAGTWPEAKVAMYKETKGWEDLGRLGDSTEINGLTVYNGAFYGGCIPRAEVFRYQGDKKWTSIRRLFTPEGWEPLRVGVDSRRKADLNGQQWKEWSRVTSLTVFGGKLFAGIGNCTSSVRDAPCDVHGKVYSMEAGKSISFDYDLGSGWKHLVAVRDNNKLKLYINGKLEVISAVFNPDEYDISNDKPLKMGFGQMDYFTGKICEVRIYNRALNDKEIRGISKNL